MGKNLTPLQIIQAHELCDMAKNCEHCPLLPLLGHGCIGKLEELTVSALRGRLTTDETAELAKWRAGFND